MSALSRTSSEDSASPSNSTYKPAVSERWIPSQRCVCADLPGAVPYCTGPMCHFCFPVLPYAYISNGKRNLFRWKRPAFFFFSDKTFPVSASPSTNHSTVPTHVLPSLPSPPARSGTSGASLAPERPASMVVSDVGRDHAMVTNLLEAVARGRASFAISLPTESLSASEGGPRVGHGVGIGVAARSEGSAGGGGSDGLAIGARGAAGGSETPRVPPRPSAAIPVGAAEGVPPTAGTTTPLSPNRKKTAASSRQPQPPGVGAKTTPSEGPRSTRVIFQAGEPGAGLSAGAGAMDAGSGTGGSKRDDSTPGEGALPTTKYRSARSVDADIMGAMVASVRPRDDDIAVTDTADRGVGAGVVGARRAAPTSALAPAANDGRNVYGPEIEWGLSAADGGEAAAAAASDGVAIAAVLGALEDAKEGGMRLSQLGRAAAAACRARAARKSASRRRDGAGEVEAKQELLELMGRVLRSPEVFCVCDAEDVRSVRAVRQALRTRRRTLTISVLMAVSGRREKMFSTHN